MKSNVLKIVFLTPTSKSHTNPLYRLGAVVYGHSNAITGPLILGRILKNAGHTVEIYEELYKDFDFRTCEDADCVCISTLSSSATRAYEIGDMLRAKGRRVIIGGQHASKMPEEALEHADQVVAGEGEMVIRDVVEGRLTAPIIHAAPPMNLDELPFPDYTLLKTRCAAANVIASRGCPFACSFCSTSRMFHPYRERSVESVLAELRYLKSLGFRHVNFDDDNFTANKERTKEILRRMIAEDLVFKETFFLGRTDMADDEELLCLLERAHLNRVLVGIESLNPETLRAVHKHQDISDIERCAEGLARHKIRLIASLVIGLDTDSMDAVRQGVDFAIRTHAYTIQPSVLTPFPGTPIYEQFKEEGRILHTDWQYYDMTNATFIPEQMSPWELQMEFYRAMLKFYRPPSAFGVARRFGLDSGLRRLGISMIIRLLVPWYLFQAVFNRTSMLYKIRTWRGVRAGVRTGVISEAVLNVHRRVCLFVKKISGNGTLMNRLEDKIHKGGHRKQA